MAGSSRIAAAVMMVALTAAACGGSSGNGSNVSGTSGNGGTNKSCSDPHPSNLALTFAAIVCVDHQQQVSQSDGSTEYVLSVTVTDKDPNAFNVTSTDFKILDASGHDVAAENATGSGRTGVTGCVSQSLTDNGFPLSPGKSMTLPGPLCFNLAAGSQARELVWQGDVSVKLN
jgi:hypothetical protein